MRDKLACVAKPCHHCGPFRGHRGAISRNKLLRLYSARLRNYQIHRIKHIVSNFLSCMGPNVTLRGTAQCGENPGALPEPHSDEWFNEAASSCTRELGSPVRLIRLQW